ncbi:Ras-related protein Rab-11A [Fusarium oxysporum f. sp. albedinis]|nr:Ras-related protein Rab-11A [Fusarium oxysporum f. sp. albedinis]
MGWSSPKNLSRDGDDNAVQQTLFSTTVLKSSPLFRHSSIFIDRLFSSSPPFAARPTYVRATLEGPPLRTTHFVLACDKNDRI